MLLMRIIRTKKMKITGASVDILCINVPSALCLSCPKGVFFLTRTFLCFSLQLRKLISDFSIFMSIMTFVGLDMLMGLKTPKLIVPTEFKVA